MVMSWNNLRMNRLLAVLSLPLALGMPRASAQAPATPPAPAPTPAPAVAPVAGAPGAPVPTPAAPTPTPTPTPTPLPTQVLELKDDPNVHMVAVEALVVEINEERTRDLGITYSGNQMRTVSTPGAAPGAAPTVISTDGSGIIDGGLINLGRALSPVQVPVLLKGAGGQNQVGLDPRMPGLGISLTGMNVGSGVIAARLRALLNTGDATIRTRPVAVALNKTPVRIETVNEVPVQSIIGGGQLNVEFRKVGVLMEVTPEIISLRPGVTTLNISRMEVSSVASLLTTRNVDRPVFTRSAAQQTKLTLATGETFVFGGLKTRRTEHTEDRVPILGSIPLLGLLFRSQHDVERHYDVLFFITPYILSPGENFLLPYDFKHQKALGVQTGLAEK